MKSTRVISMSIALCLFCALVLVAVQPLWAQDEAGAGAEEAMMQAMVAAGTPGEPHAALAKRTGSWSMTVKSWFDPAAEPMVTEGLAERRMILEGRVMVEDDTADMMGMPFTGYSMTGYDNVSGKYWTTWNDSMTTSILVSYGSYDAESGSYNFTGEYSDPITGGPIKVRAVIRCAADTETMDYYETRDGHEARTMEIVFTRK